MPCHPTIERGPKGGMRVERGTGLTSRGVSTSGPKAYTWVVVEKRPPKTNEPHISFHAGEVEYCDHDDTLVISVHVANALMKRVMVDTGSLTDILYKDAFQKLRLATVNLSPMSSTLPGFIGNSIAPLQTIVLPIIVSQESRSKTPMVTFMVVGLSTAYNIILRRSTLNRLRVVVFTYHHAIKFPIGAGVGEAKSDS
ncbi:hypothetical protein BHE74_00022119 [Ensete ventricosum]|nr:hypothetical protein BHE74_00022119 [Ensete ventricosum]